MTTGHEIIRTPRYEQILAAAEQLARDRGDSYIGVEHLQLAILADRDAVPTQEMIGMGLDPEEIAKSLEATMRTPGYQTESNRARFLDGTTVDHNE
ncbi:Clp protease N-terminal domain-containing protein [Nocardia lijiangensis]|uniref:Clp protease N-terminal domain-containing protein n=1 Tax=Nocardia lijiangensis TaxID=299618 RepID=UPI00083600FD|nr:Clp protease N-terminal domain-containing protein [Nocardia lijiangensis]